MGFWCEIGFRSGHQAERTRTMRTGIFLPVASFAFAAPLVLVFAHTPRAPEVPFSRTRTHLARDLLTRAPLCTPLLAAFAPLPTPLHTARLGLSL